MLEIFAAVKRCGAYLYTFYASILSLIENFLIQDGIEHEHRVFQSLKIHLFHFVDFGVRLSCMDDDRADQCPHEQPHTLNRVQDTQRSARTHFNRRSAHNKIANYKCFLL